MVSPLQQTPARAMLGREEEGGCAPTGRPRAGLTQHGGWACHRHGAHVAPMWEPGRVPMGLKPPFVPGNLWHLAFRSCRGERGGNQATKSLAVPTSTGQMPPAQQGGWAQRALGQHGGHCQGQPRPGPGHVPQPCRRHLRRRECPLHKHGAPCTPLLLLTA